MPHQILAAVNHDGKRMPMCIYPEQMHDFRPMVTVQDADASARVTLVTFACTHCGAELCTWDPEPPAPGEFAPIVLRGAREGETGLH